MKKAKFKAFCPYEIGDKIQFEKGNIIRTMTITDIIAMQSVKNGTTTFRLELDGWYMLDTNLHDINCVSPNNY